MGNNIVRQAVGLHFTVTLRDVNGVQYSSSRTSSSRNVSPSTSSGPIGRNLTYKDNFTFMADGVSPISLDMTVTFNLNYNTANVTALQLQPSDRNHFITFTLTSIDFPDRSGNIHNRNVTGNVTATFPASAPGNNCPCPPLIRPNAGAIFDRIQNPQV